MAVSLIGSRAVDNVSDDNSFLATAFGEALAESMSFNTGQKLKTFDGSIGSEAERWLEEFEAYALARKWSESAKLRNISGFLEKDAKSWYLVTVTLSSSPPRTYSALRNLFNDHHIPAVQVDRSRQEMIRCRQLDGQHVSHYITEKVLLCKRYRRDWTDEECFPFVKEGLQSNLRCDVIRHGVETMDQLRHFGVRFQEASKIFEESKKLAKSGTTDPKPATATGTSGLTGPNGTNTSRENQLKKMAETAKGLVGTIQELMYREKGVKSDKRHPGKWDNKWSSDGRPICSHCLETGHYRLDCDKWKSNEERKD